ncbi:MAG: putative collagen-binding protein A, partial [Actinomyces urogenitalis DORA_12]
PLPLGTYRVSEVTAPTGYVLNAQAQDVTLTKDTADGTVSLANSLERTTVKVAKTWSDNDNQDGKRPDSVTVRLLADGEVVDNQTLTLNAESEWKGSFSGLPKFKAGKEIAYTVSEDEVSGYSTAYSGTAAGGFTVTNTITGKVSVAVTKAWAGIDADAAPAVLVQLYADGVASGDPVTLDGNAEDGSWSHIFEGLDQYTAEGKAIAYTVAEQGVENGKLSAGGHDYTVKVAQDGDSWTVTNTMENPKTSVSGKKVWDDADNQDGIRPDSVTVELLANGAATGKTVEVPADGDGSFTFTGLPNFDAKGIEIAYSVDEVGVP